MLPLDDPKPREILKLKVLDPAMGSGHFLVEACRFLGEKLYEACRACDEQVAHGRSEDENAADKDGEAAFHEASRRLDLYEKRPAGVVLPLADGCTTDP